MIAVHESGGREPVGGTQCGNACQHAGYLSGVEHGYARVSGLYEVILESFVLKYRSQIAFPLTRLAQFTAVRGEKFVNETDERGNLFSGSEAFE